jgi:L,D-transpeptidase-like protein/LysM domain-containing protein
LKPFLFIVLFFCFFTFPVFADHFSIPSKKIRSPCKINYPSDKKIKWECKSVKKGDSLETLYGTKWKDVARFNRIDRRHVYAGMSLKVPNNLLEIENFSPMPEKIPISEGEEKFILIDLSEQFLAAYKFGDRIFSFPIASGQKSKDYETPTGEFRVTMLHRDHQSSLYTIEETKIPYPMNYALRFFISRKGISYWIHGRDLPGFPASHGCVGLYDEAMQKVIYGSPSDPQLDDARELYKWVEGNLPVSGNEIPVINGPKVLIIGRTP